MSVQCAGAIYTKERRSIMDRHRKSTFLACGKILFIPEHTKHRVCTAASRPPEDVRLSVQRPFTISLKLICVYFCKHDM